MHQNFMSHIVSCVKNKKLQHFVLNSQWANFVHTLFIKIVWRTQLPSVKRQHWYKNQSYIVLLKWQWNCKNIYTKMDKGHAASAPPPAVNDAPPPYPGTVNDYGQPYAAGGFQQVPQAGPPPGTVIWRQWRLKPKHQFYSKLNKIIRQELYFE